MEKEFDIIVFGASGYTGELAVEEMAKSAFQQDFLWAVAGRNVQKLEEMLVKVQKRLNTDYDLESIKIFEADIDNRTSLEMMCEKTKILINCVGPYVKYGEPVLEACLKCRTHVLDLSVEISYLNSAMLKYHHEAETRGVYIIISCGVGYLYFDMAIQLLQQKYKDRISRINVFIKPEISLRSIHSGTWNSLMNDNIFTWNNFSTRQKIYYQIMNKTKSKFSVLRLSYPMILSKAAKGIGFLQPSVTHLLHVSLDMKEELFKDDHVKVNYYWTVHSMATLAHFVIIALVFVFMVPFRCGRWLVTRYACCFSCGLVPKSTVSEKTEDIATLNFTAVAKVRNLEHTQNWNICGNLNRTVVLHGCAPPSYKTSAICIVQAALTVLLETDHLPKRGGAYAPLVAFAKTSLPSRLQKNGITYKEKEREFVV